MKKPDFPTNYNGHGLPIGIGNRVKNSLITRIPMYTFFKKDSDEYNQLKNDFEKMLEAEYLEAKGIYDLLFPGVILSSSASFPDSRSVEVQKIGVVKGNVVIYLKPSEAHVAWVEKENQLRGMDLKPIPKMKFGIATFIALVLSKQLFINMQKYAVGQNVLFIPDHAGGDHSHPSCEKGVVSKVEELPGIGQRVWVRYTTGDTGALTPTKNLVHLQIKIYEMPSM